MKVLLIDQIHNVNYKFTDSLVKALQKQNVDVTTLDCFVSGEKGYSKVQKVLNYISSYRQICKELAKGGYDVLHLQWYILSPLDYYYVSKIKRKYKVKIVQTVHDIYPFHEYPFDKTYFDKLYRICDEIVLQTDHAFNEFRELFPDIIERTSLIPHGNFCDYAEPIDKHEAREKLGIADDKKVMLFYGQLKKVKGLKTAIEALSLVKDRIDNILFIIAGKDQDDSISNYTEYIKDNGLEQYLLIENRYIEDEEEKYFLSASDLMVLPYTEIYQSGVIQVAFAYDKPVVCSNLPGFTELITDGVNGYVFETSNAESLADKICECFENKPIDISNASVKDKLDWGKIAEKYGELYAK